MLFINEMVGPINPDVNKSNHNINVNVIVNHSQDLTMPAIKKYIIHPDFGKVINKGPNNNFNINVNYSTNLEIPELAPKEPVPNPVLEKIKNLNPVQQISIIGVGLDPEVIIHNPIRINPYVRLQPTTNISNAIVNIPKIVEQPKPQNIAQSSNSLTLPEIFDILSQYGINKNILKNGNIKVEGNKIIINYTQSSPLTSVIGDQIVGNITNNYTLEIENVNGYVIVKYKNYQTSTYMGQASSPSITENYYVIDPIAKKVINTIPGTPTATIWTQPIMSPSDVINNVLSQYGYKIPNEYLNQINNLQPGQSITINARAYNYDTNTWGNVGAQFKITYLGNNQYQIESVDKFYSFNDFYHPWTSINQIITVPTYTYNLETNQISTTPLKISGQVTTHGTTKLNEPYYNATYNINQTIPINYTIEGNQIVFKTGTPQTNVNLQSTNLPTITSQQLQQLQSGQNLNIKPGWYYNPETGEIVKLEYKTTTQPQTFSQNTQIFLNPFGYSSLDPNKITYIGVNFDTNTIYLINSYGQIINTQSFSDKQTMLNYLKDKWFIDLTTPSENNLDFGYSSQPITKTTKSPTIYQMSFGLPISGNILSNVFQSIQNWFTNMYNKYIQTITKPVPNINIMSNNIESDFNQHIQYIESLKANFTLENPNIISQISQKLGYLKLWEEIKNNPNYPFGISSVSTTINPFSISMPLTTHTTATWEQLEYSTNPQFRKTISNIKEEIGTVSKGIQAFRFYSDVASLLGLKESAQYYESLAEEAEQYGTPAYQEALKTGKAIKTLETTLILLPFGILGGAAATGTTAARFATEFAKNYALVTSFNLLASNIGSYLTTGKTLSPYETIQIATENIPFSLSYVTIARSLGSIANPVLESIGIGEKTSKRLAIASRVLYDTGVNFAAGFGSDIAMQGFKNIVGWQSGINLNEALTIGLVTGGLTLGIEGIWALKNPGGFVMSLGYYPKKMTVTNIIPSVKRGNIIEAYITGSGLVTEAYPKTGGRFFTEADFSNIKPAEYPFDISGKVELTKASAVKNKLGDIEIIKLLNEPGQTYYAYKGKIETSTKGGSVSSNIWGIFKAQKAQGIENFETYMNLVKTEQQALQQIYPEFEQLSTVPTEGIYLFKNFLNKKYIPLVENINRGQTLIEAGINANFDIPEILAGSRYSNLVTISSDLVKKGILSPGEAQILLETATKEYSAYTSYLNEIKQQILQDISNKIVNPDIIKITNLEGLYPYIKPEDLKINVGKMPNPYFLNKIPYYRSRYNVYMMGNKAGNVELSVQPTEFNLNQNFNKVYLVGDIGIIKTSTKETYKTMGEGIIGNYNKYGIGTMFQVMKTNRGNAWYIVQQSGFIPLSNKRSLIFNYLRGVDPYTQTEQILGQNIKGQSLSHQELQEILKELGGSKIIAPPKDIRVTPYGIPINIASISYNNILSQNQYSDHSILNKYNIQNELNVLRNKALEKLRENYLSLTNTINPLQNQFSREQLYGIYNIFKLQNLQAQQLISGERQLEKLRERLKQIERQEFINIEKIISPKIQIEKLRDLAIRSLLGQELKIKTEPKTPPTPPTILPRPPIPFGWPEFSMRIQPSRGLAPSLSKGIKSMYDIQYVLSRLRW